MRSKTSFFNRTIFHEKYPPFLAHVDSVPGSPVFFRFRSVCICGPIPQRLHAANLAEAQLREVVTCVNWGTTANFVYIFVMAIVLVLLIFSYLYSARSCKHDACACRSAGRSCL